MTGKRIIIAAILVLAAILLGYIVVTDGTVNSNYDEEMGKIIGNPDYEDSLYISYTEFKEEFEKKIIKFKYHITKDEKKREYQYHFEDNMVLRAGVQSDNDMLSFIIFKWPEDKTDTGIKISKILYRIFNPDASDVAINNHLIEREVINGEIEFSLDDADMYYPNEPVRFGYEEKAGYMSLYINDEAMGY